MITMDKNYQTRSGLPVRIICVDRKGEYPVVAIANEDDGTGGYIIDTTIDGAYVYVVGFAQEYDQYDIIEIDLMKDVQVDDKILVRDSVIDDWQKKHYAGKDDNFYYTWPHGTTSWSTGFHSEIDRVGWKLAKLPTD
jgi:hypothetical protein